MKHLCITALFCLSVAGLSVAQAESWTVTGPFRDEFLGCQRVGTQVQCQIKSTYTGSGATYYGATYYAFDTAAYAPDKRRYIAVRTTFDGRDITRASVNVSRNSPVTVTYTFDYPTQFDRIAMLFIDSGIVKDVPIKGSAPVATPSAPAPQNTPPAPATPSQPGAGNAALSSFDIKLTGCQSNGKGGFTCTGAELTPKP